MQVWVGLRVGNWAAEPKIPPLFINQDLGVLLREIKESYNVLEGYNSKNLVLTYTDEIPLMIYPFGENPEDPNSKVVCIRPYNV